MSGTHNVVLRLASTAGGTGPPGPFTRTSHSHSLLYAAAHATNYTDVVSEPVELPEDAQPVSAPASAPVPATSTTTTYASCFGLPYQDHNYGAPPPPTPPASPPPAPKVNGHIDIDNVSCHTTVVTSSTPPGRALTPLQQPTEQYAGDDSVTRCICHFQHDDGYMICCDQCGVWQHVDCMGVDRQNIPDSYLCEACQPRPVDTHRARQLQIRKRELFNIDTSATETEDETPHGRRKAKNKKKKEKRRDGKESGKLPGAGKKLRRQSAPGRDRKTLLKPLSPLGKKRGAVAVKKSPVKPKSLKSVGPMRPKINSSRVPWEHEPENTFEEAEHNYYSLDVQDMLTTRKLNGVQAEEDLDEGDRLSTAPLLVQRCSVAQVTAHHKGLEALEDLAPCKPVIEYRGKVMLREQYDKENIHPARKQPHVLFYRKFDQQDLCIDATVYGNDARFVRRSCTPNAEVRHILDKNNVHFVIYSLERISNGAEITIAFDFKYQECGYDVECACGKPVCPVVKSQKGQVDGPPPPNKLGKKRRRSTKSVEETETTHPAGGNGGSGGTNSPQKQPPTSPPAAAPAKRKRAQSLKVQLPSTPKDDKKSSSAVLSPVAKEEPKASFSPTSPTSGLSSPSNVEGDRRPSREDRKMDAILKAIERMERREERRREALARMAPRKDKEKKEEPEKEIKVEKPEPSSESDSGVGTNAETSQQQQQQQGQEEQVQVNTEEVKEEVKQESAPPAPAKRIKKKKGPKRRSQRSSSSISVARDTDTPVSADEGSNLSTPVSAVPSEQNSTTTTPSAGQADRAFRFPKTKKLMMNEWLNGEKDVQRPLSIRTECLEGSTEEEEAADFVKCVPSPHAGTLPHLRRNSMSNTTSNNHGKAVNSTGNGDSVKGFAKKRWLRQAMFESSGPSESRSPVHSGGASSPNASCSNSPGASPPGAGADFVTPLKKRRLARESVSQEHPNLPMPSTPLLNSCGLPMEGLDASPVVSDNERGASDSEKSLAESEKSRSDLEPTGRYKNGLRPGLSPVGPSDNLFEKFQVGLGSSGTLFKQRDALDSALSDSLPTSAKISLEYAQAESSRDVDSALEDRLTPIIEDASEYCGGVSAPKIENDCKAQNSNAEQGNDKTSAGDNVEGCRAPNVCDSTDSKSTALAATKSVAGDHGRVRSSDSEHEAEHACSSSTEHGAGTKESKPQSPTSSFSKPSHEEGELDSSFSQSDADVSGTSVSAKDNEGAVTCSSSSEPLQAPKKPEEKEEGEITSEDEATEEEAEAAVTCSASTSGRDPTASLQHDISPSFTTSSTGLKASWQEREDQGLKYKGSSYNHTDARGHGCLDSYIDSTCEEQQEQEHDSVSSSEASSAEVAHGVVKDVSSSGEMNGVSPDAGVSPNTTGGVSSSGIPVSRKKVSLLEYRKRMKSTKSSESPSSSRSYRRASSSTSSGRSTPTSWEAREAGYGVISTPPLPGVNSIDSPGTTGSGSRGGKRGLASNDKKEADVRWNASATEAERIREQTQLSLSERLRREFGLDPSESEEEDENKQEDEEPPPPPPPALPMYPPPMGPQGVQLPPAAGPGMPPPPPPPLGVAPPTAQVMLPPEQLATQMRQSGQLQQPPPPVSQYQQHPYRPPLQMPGIPPPPLPPPPGQMPPPRGPPPPPVSMPPGPPPSGGIPPPPCGPLPPPPPPPGPGLPPPPGGPPAPPGPLQPPVRGPGPAPFPQHQQQEETKSSQIPSLMSVPTFPTTHFRQHVLEGSQRPAAASSSSGSSSLQGPNAVSSSAGGLHSPLPNCPNQPYQKLLTPKKIIFGEQFGSSSSVSASPVTTTVGQISYSHGSQAPATSTYHKPP